MARVRLAWRGRAAFVRYARSLERKLNGGTRQHGVFAAVAGVVPPVLIDGRRLLARRRDCIRLLGMLVNVVVLYFLMGFRRFSHAISAIVAGVAGQRPRSRRAARSRRGAAAPRATSPATMSPGSRSSAASSTLIGRSFAVLFWFVVLPGPAGAVLYRAARCSRRSGRAASPASSRRRWCNRAPSSAARRGGCSALLDWIPVRLTALVIRGRRRFRGRRRLLAHAGRALGGPGRRHGDRHPAGERRGRAGRAARRPAADARRAIPMCARTSAWATRSSPTSCPRRWVSSGARWCCGCC